MAKFITLLAVSACILALNNPSPSSDRATAFREMMSSVCDSLENVLQKTPESYEELRAAYKRFEPFIEYLDPQLVAQQVNGAPLPKLDAKSQFVEVLEPHGLQVLDELMADDQASKDDVQKEWSYVAGSLRDALAVVRSAPWTDRMMLECARTGTMRLMAMGLTNFDRPGTSPRPSDLRLPFETTSRMVLLFAPSLPNKDAQELRKTVERLTSRFTSLTKRNDDNLDRMTIIRDVLDPFYATVADLHAALGVEYADEIGPSIPTVDPRARSMFASNTLVPAATSGIRPDQITPQLVELGRQLFYDPLLSANGTRSCSSCHQPDKAFTDGLKTSLALDGVSHIDRNAPTLINAVFARRFFYDLRAMRLSDVISHVVTNEREFGTTLIDMVGRVRSSSEYVTEFEQVFRRTGTSSVDAGNINMAISAYLTSLVSIDSPVDRYLRGEKVALSASVKRGFNLFMGKGLCGTCHFAPTFAGYVPPAFVETESEIIGVPTSDVGRAGGILREQSAIYRHSFKTMTVRNLKHTAPYMHNGFFKTLEEVVDFYDRGGGKGLGNHLEYQTLPFDELKLTKQEKKDLISFLRTL